MADSKREQFVKSAIASDVEHCIAWPFAVRKSNGYGAHSLSRARGKTNIDAHRYVCELAHGTRPNGLQAAHKCGNKLCVNPKHLYWATALANMADAKQHGTLRGGGRYRQRFFNAEIADIRSSSESILVLAAKYSSAPSYIGRIRRQHLNGE